MNESIPTTTSPTTSTTSSTGPTTPAPDDVWGVNRPPALPPTFSGTRTGSPGPDAHGRRAGTGPGPGTGPTHLDRGLTTLTRSPLRRDRARGVVGGVSAGIARSLDVSPNAVRLAAVALALFFGVGVGLYLVAWAVLPDENGRTHAEQAVRGGRPASLAVVGLAALPVLGVLAGVLGTGWPVLLAVAVVALVAAKRKGHLSHPVHG